MQAATALFVAQPKLGQPPSVPLIGEELVETHGLFIVLPEPAYAARIERCEYVLSGRMPLVGCKFAKPNGLTVIPRKSAVAHPVKS